MEGGTPIRTADQLKLFSILMERKQNFHTGENKVKMHNWDTDNINANNEKMKTVIEYT